MAFSATSKMNDLYSTFVPHCPIPTERGIGLAQRRWYANESIFESSESAWDHVFNNIDAPSPQNLLASSQPSRKVQKPRRHTMTARERRAFDEMFNMIFNTVLEEKSSQPTSGIGKTHLSGMNDLTVRLRHHSKKIEWTSEADQELDRKKEEMEYCNTDQELLDWAMREVFDESQRYEEMARHAMQQPSSSSQPVHLQPPSYPHLIAALMRTFRDKYADPYLALSIFDHARHLSIASYVFGCTTPAYNELIETRWKCFRDVRGVCDALEEMRINGIEMDSRTRALAETVRREVGERNKWEEESALDSGEVWAMVARIEKLTAVKSRKPREDRRKRDKKWSMGSEAWKLDAFEEDSEDRLEFGDWLNDSQLHTTQ